MWFTDMDDQIAVLCLGSPLTSVWSKSGYGDSKRCAGSTLITIGSVDKVTTAAKTLLHQIAVDLAVNLLTGSCNMRAGDAPLDVAARVCGRDVILNLRQGESGAVCHALAGSDTASSFQYTSSNFQTGTGCLAKCLTRATNVSLGISRAPSDARWKVFCWQSISGNW